jgi:hypothetical protein
MPDRDAKSHVITLMNEALAAVTHPGLILTSVCEMLRPKSGRKLPGRRKLDADQAAAAAMAVTGIMERLGVEPAEACRRAKVASDPKNFYAFHLTRDERATGKTEFTERRFNRTIKHYHDLIVATARIADVDPTPLLDELAVAVRDFLEPFVPIVGRDEFEELADHLLALGPYFSKRQEAPDGTSVDLDGLWAACRARQLEFNPDTKTLEYEGEDPESTWHYTLPRVFLFPRIVGRVQVECGVNDGSNILDHTLESIKKRSRSIGKVSAELVYAVNLAIMPARGRGKAKVVFLLEPWTGLPLGPRSKRKQAWGAPSFEIWCPGFPFVTSRAADEDGSFDLVAAGEVEMRCPEFRNWFAGVDTEDPRIHEQTFRVVEVTPEIVELMFRHENAPRAWDLFGKWVGQSALPQSAEMPGGVPSEQLLARFCDALYREDEKALDRQLLMSAAPMAKALEEFLETSSDDITRRKASFMRRMRS